MKKTAYVATAILLSLGALAGCSREEESPEPLEISDTGAAVLGRWSIDRIDYHLCRNNICNAINYSGKQQDYFEFKADSACLVRTDDNLGTIRQSYKIDYSPNGNFTLSNSNWQGKFKIKELRQKRLVLENNSIGYDLQVIFTDVYYLYR